MSFRTGLSIITFIAIILIVYLGRHDIVRAFELLGQVNIWILLLLIPVQLISYYAVGAIIFDYLKAKGDLGDTGRWTMARIALELNFVNHMLPSGGVSGISYLNWRLKKLGVSTGRATMSQVVRYGTTFGVYVVLLLIALIFIALDGAVNRFTVLFSGILTTVIVAGILFIMYVIGSETRLRGFSSSMGKMINSFGRRVMRRQEPLIKTASITSFFEDMHRDYNELKAEPRVLKKPIIWAFVVNIAEIGLFMLAFAALGTVINPAPLLIAYGLAGLAGIFVVTPGGAGAYEALMIFFLGTAGVPGGVAIAAIVLARVILILGTIISGYVFYQLAILKYGRSPSVSQ